MPRPKVYDDALRSALVEAAADQLVLEGEGHFSVRSVAQAAGTSTNAVYTIFGDKAGLVTAVVREAFESFSVSQESTPPTGHPMEDLRALGRAYREWALSRPNLYALIFGGRLRRDAPDLVTEPAFHPLLRGVEAAIEEGYLREADPAVIALSFWAGTHGLIALESSIIAHLPREFRDELFEEHLMALDHGWVIKDR